MIKKVLLCTIFVLCGFCFAFSQQLFPKKHDVFIKSFTDYLKDGNQIKDTTIVLSINEAWSSAFTKKQKKHFIGLANYAISKRQRKHPFFYYAFGSIAKAVLNKNLPAPEVDTLIYSIKYALDTLDNRSLNKSLNTLYSFISNDALFLSNYNALYADNYTFKIRFRRPEAPSNVNIGDEGMEEDNEQDDDQDEEGEYFEEWDEEGFEDEWSDDDWDTSSQLDAEVEEEEVVETAIEESILTIGYTPPQQPIKEGWYIEFEKVDLTFATHYDTTKLNQTSGYLLLKTGQFAGSGGTMAWNTEKDTNGVGEDIFGTFREFNFNINAPKLEAEGVTLSYDNKLQDTVQGVFLYKSIKPAKGKPSTYPRFMSYNNDVKLKYLGEGIEYQGGFALNGERIYSESVNGGKAELTVFHNNEKKFKARANPP